VLGLCRIFETKLKEQNPSSRNITYDVRDLFTWIDGLSDMGCLVYRFSSLPSDIYINYYICVENYFPFSLEEYCLLVLVLMVSIFLDHITSRKLDKMTTFDAFFFC